jgi:uncharacterized RDD family membrane protein YckC
MAFCHKCGAELQPGDRFCAACGAPIREAAAPPPRPAPAPHGATPNSTAAVAAGALDYKGVGVRFVAHLVDLILVGIVYGVTGRIIAGVFGGVTEGGFELHGGPAAFAILLNFVISMGYFIILESSWNGQTLGKKLVGIRVVREDGSPIDVQEAVLRNLLRIIDALPFLYLLGIILIWTSDKKQRLGDRVAKTVVVGA